MAGYWISRSNTVHRISIGTKTSILTSIRDIGLCTSLTAANTEPNGLWQVAPHKCFWTIYGNFFIKSLRLYAFSIFLCNSSFGILCLITTWNALCKNAQWNTFIKIWHNRKNGRVLMKVLVLHSSVDIISIILYTKKGGTIGTLVKCCD